MMFAHPWALLLLPLVALACWWDAEGGPAAAARYPGEAPAAGRTPRALLARWAPPALRGLGLTLLAVGLARPQKVSSRAAGAGLGVDIMLAVDTSLSMSAIDFKPNRLEAAKETARRFVLGRAHDRIGLVTFGGASQLVCPLTLDYPSLLEQMDALDPGMTKADGTAIGDGIASAARHLQAGDAKSKVLILLTDGRSNTGVVDPLTAARAAKAFGVKIYTIGTAGRGSSLMPVNDPVNGKMLVRIDDDLDEDLLAEVARLGDGRYFRATSLKELREVYDTIDQLEKSKIKLPELVSRDDLYRVPVTLALVLLAAESALSATWLLRWP